MSYYIRLRDAEERTILPRAWLSDYIDRHGLPLGALTHCELDVMVGYAEHFDFQVLNGMTGADAEEMLTEAVERLGTERSNDEWEISEGNVGYVCSLLKEWATDYPDGVWDVS